MKSFMLFLTKSTEIVCVVVYVWIWKVELYTPVVAQVFKVLKQILHNVLRI